MVKATSMVRWAIVLGSILLPFLCLAQLKVRSFEEVEALQKTNPRNIVVFIYTDWCRYCDAMKKVTFKNEEITSTLNEKFYFIQLNAETKQDILFNNRRFKFKPNGSTTGVHELAEALNRTEEKSGYPALVILNKKLEITFQYNGFLNNNALGKILSHIAP